MIKIFIYIDESGTLPDQHDKFVVLAAVASNGKIAFEKKVKTSRLTEVKFYTTGRHGRTFYLESLAKESIEIFTLAINKGSQKIPDSPENYAVLSWLLLIDCLAYFKNNAVEIVFDRHFARSSDELILFRTLRKLLDQKLLVRSVDSQKESGVGRYPLN